MAVITTDARVQRERAVENALASGRMEGLDPPHEAKVIFQKYVDGDLTLEEMGHAIDQLVAGEYGPVRLPRDDRP